MINALRDIKKYFYYEEPVDVYKEIGKYLLKDEIVDKVFILKEQTIYTTPNRLLSLKGSSFRDISYSHISSIEYKSTPKRALILFGILNLLMGINPLLWGLFAVALLFMSVSIISLIGSYFWQSPQVKIRIAGMSKSWKLSGRKNTLNALFLLVRERKV